MGSRGWAAVTLGALVVALIVVAAVRVPWSAPPAPRADQLAALRGLPADAVARGRAFHTALRPGSYGALALGLLVALILGLTPLGARLVGLVGRPFGGNWVAEAVLGGFVLVGIGEVVTLPLGMWQETILRRYGLSTQTWGSWTLDLLKSYAVGAVIGAVVLLGFFGVTRLAPRWWWAFLAAGAAGLTVLMTFVFPVLVEPVFNKFTPMPDSPLRTNLMAMASADGVPVRDVLVADASRRTRAVNAYVSGLGPTRRIVVYDTMLTEATPDEVVSVAAHELGHAKDNDVLTGTLLGALGTAAAVIALYLLGSWGWLLRRAGVDTIGEPRATGTSARVSIGLRVGRSASSTAGGDVFGMADQPDDAAEQADADRRQAERQRVPRQPQRRHQRDARPRPAQAAGPQAISERHPAEQPDSRGEHDVRPAP